MTKIRGHNHFNGKCRGAACQSCNTQEGKASKEIPVFFQNGSSLVTELIKYENQYNKVEVLPKTSEEYISITYGNMYRKFIFKDSYRFLQQGLGDIAESMTLEDLKIMTYFYKNFNFFPISSPLEESIVDIKSRIMDQPL